jgi:serine protease Do
MSFKTHLLKFFLVTCLSLISTNLSYAESSTSQVTDFTKVAKKAIPSVVTIRVELKNTGGLGNFFEFQSPFGQDDLFNRFFGLPNSQSHDFKQQGQGSGFIVSPDGYIVTNNHIVKDAEKIEVLLNNGQEYEAKVIGQDPNTDIAIIKIDGKNLPALQFGNSDDLEVGQWVVAIGNALGLNATLTVGVVSAKERSDLGLLNYEDFIQTDAAINRGNSGGPLLNLNAEVIGMNTAIASNTGGNMGIGFAIPSHVIKTIIDQLIHDGSVSRGYIGILMQKVEPDLATAFGLDKAEGILITEIVKNSPAEKAGLMSGDVILKLNNQEVKGLAQFRNTVSMMKQGTSLVLDVNRKGKIIPITVVIGKLDNDIAINGKETPSNTMSKLGISVESTESAQDIGYTEDYGVLVTKVEPNSLASLAGIKKGSLILEVNRQKIRTPGEFNKLVQETESNKPLLLLIKQGSITRFVSIKG